MKIEYLLGNEYSITVLCGCVLSFTNVSIFLHFGKSINDPISNFLLVLLR